MKKHIPLDYSPFTDNWLHASWSPALISDGREIHTGGKQLLLLPPQKRTGKLLSAVSGAIEKAFLPLMGDSPRWQFIDFHKLMLSVRQYSMFEKWEDRAVKCGGFWFDAERIFGLGIALYGVSGPVHWGVQESAPGHPGHTLYLRRDDWGFALMKLTDGNYQGPTVLHV